MCTTIGSNKIPSAKAASSTYTVVYRLHHSGVESLVETEGHGLICKRGLFMTLTAKSVTEDANSSVQMRFKHREVSSFDR